MSNKEIIVELFNSLRLGHVSSAFISLGYDRLQDIVCIKKEDIDAIITNPNVKEKFLRSLYEERVVVSLWLQDLGLSSYQESLFSFGLTNLKSYINLSKTSKEISGIASQAHRCRLLRAVQVLAECNKSHVVATGKWDKHEHLAGGRNGYFLCLTAEVYKNNIKDASKTALTDQKRTVKFLVDSGSDVVTLRHDVISELQLDCIGTAKQCGAGGKIIKTPVYYACVNIGGHRVDVEVVGDVMDSLGTPVLRHFNHFIQDEKHVWLTRE
ncbi:uncharacterized protein LOC116304348 isoform X2 [Actinia tenebrosa]|uniref:Uncharacterized protein LOC116304348 isoform X2 n=1 Tax=Actinia tenebrosa TaxID=6105 RepID=A0A6P8ISP7_ACTTE|nr:uncharacterized protein LOC116304348 isoform X2 [Actinia tenebrosa]